MFGIGRRKTHGQLAKSELSESFDHLRQAATHAAGGVGATVGPRVQSAREYMQPTAGRIRDGAMSGWGSTMAALAPLAVAASDGARQAGTVARKAKSNNLKKLRKPGSKRSGRKWPMITGLVVAGAAVGTVGAIAMRRRQQQQWEEYDPSRPLDTLPDDPASAIDTAPDNPLRDPAAGRSTTGEQVGSMGDRTAAAMDEAKNRAASALSEAKGKASSAADSASSKAKSTTEPAKQSTGNAMKPDGVMSNASAPSRNSRS
ncbi:hypothetical protein [Polymorphospora sp. NPDC050346]|uniref:hypothetical protein n=1 Tax=Polymorphospora sp. NPDC050346 TaxID=3155780 RepID=UPI0033DFC99E